MFKRLLKRFKGGSKKPSAKDRLIELMETDYQWLHADPQIKILIERYYPLLTEEADNYVPEDVFNLRRRLKMAPLDAEDFLSIRIIPVEPTPQQKDQNELISRLEDPSAV